MPCKFPWRLELQNYPVKMTELFLRAYLRRMLDSMDDPIVVQNAIDRIVSVIPDPKDLKTLFALVNVSPAIKFQRPSDADCITKAIEAFIQLKIIHPEIMNAVFMRRKTLSGSSLEALEELLLVSPLTSEIRKQLQDEFSTKIQKKELALRYNQSYRILCSDCGSREYFELLLDAQYDETVQNLAREAINKLNELGTK